MFNYRIPLEVGTNQRGYEFLADLYRSVSSQLQKEITLDFSICLSFDANLAAALGAILDKLLEEGYEKIMFTYPTSRAVRRVLSRNHFFRAWNFATQIEDRENYITYRRFASNDSDSFKIYIEEELLKKQKFPVHTELVGHYITENIFEIYANAIMHGETEYVYSCGEYNTKIHTLDMTIVDCGLTIPYNVNTHLTKNGLTTLNPCEAMVWAFEDGNTTKSNTGGLGLAILKQFIEINQGCLQMVSGNAFLEFDKNGTKSQLLSIQFPGTIVNVKFNFDDRNKYLMEGEENNIDFNDLL